MSVGEPRWKTTIIGLMEAALVITIAFSVATAFNEWHRFLELFSHFRLQYFVVSLLLTVAFGILKWRGYVIAGIAVTVFNGWFIVPWYLPNGSEADSSDVTVVLSNVLASNGNAERFLSFVEETQPELLIMQEATPDWIQQIDSLDSSYPYKVTEPRDDPFGIALYSKFPLDVTAVNASYPLDFPEIVARAIIADQRLNIISTHPIPPIGQTNYGSRNLQLDAVAKLAARTPEPLMLIGDLNITMWANHYDRLVETSGLQNARQGFGIKPTWPLFMPFAMIPIDHCMVSDDITVTSFRTGPNIGSDHLPIVVTLSLSPTT
ncbi:MAG: endonuclease/exonuclease/phosphatase family protein [Woeseiaceae bacterium]|nr:endonuclease/exonuclease/phosphatase family protein [Woeseiaceae bacterium]